MPENMKTFSVNEENKLSNQELIEYYRELREYLKKCPYNNFETYKSNPFHVFCTNTLYHRNLIMSLF